MPRRDTRPLSYIRMDQETNEQYVEANELNKTLYEHTPDQVVDQVRALRTRFPPALSTLERTKDSS